MGKLDDRGEYPLALTGSEISYVRKLGGASSQDGYETLEAIAAFANKAQDSTLTPSGTTQTIDWSLGNFVILDLGSASGNVTLTFINPRVSTPYLIKVIQGSPSRTLILPSNVKMSGRTAPTTLSITAIDNAVDWVALVYDGTDYSAEHKENFG